MTKKMFLLFIVWSVILASCESEPDRAATESKVGDNFVFEKGKDRYQQALVDKAQGDSAPFTIKEVKLVDSPRHLLQVTTTHPSNCEGKFEFIWDGSVALSHPPQVYLMLRYNAECSSDEQSETTTLVLDLEEFVGKPDLVANATFHVINGSITDSSNDKNVSSN